MDTVHVALMIRVVSVTVVSVTVTAASEQKQWSLLTRTQVLKQQLVVMTSNGVIAMPNAESPAESRHKAADVQTCLCVYQWHVV